MLTAIYTGISGLQAYSQGLQTISNNVSNLNTSGYKSNKVTFNDYYGNSNSGLSLVNSNRSAGNGVSIGDVQVDFSQGDLRQSQNGLDLGIEGSGFFVLVDGNELLYKRTGSFTVNNDGYIVLQGTDYRLGIMDSSGRASELNIDARRTYPPEATTTIKFADNLSSTATEQTVADVKVYDKTGKENLWQVKFVKNTGSVVEGTTVPVIGDVWDVTVTTTAGREVGKTTLRFNQGEVDPDTAKLTISDPDTAGLSVILDFSENVTSFSSGTVSTLRAASVDGKAVGTVTNITVNEQGQVELTYSNEEKLELGAVAIADFRDPQSLERFGDGLFKYNGVGERRLLSGADTDGSRVVAGRLEASNVDLSSAFGELILIQRGFQASSQLISVSNDMIQQLFGIRGQG